MPLSATSSRQHDRLALRHVRNALNPCEQKRAACRLKQNLLSLSECKAAQNIACYYAADGEIALWPFMRWAEKNHKQLYLPRIHAQFSMDFASFKTKQKLRTNRYNIPEPAQQAKLICSAKLDIIVIPMVGFNQKGHRLGMGGGYYDRALASLARKAKRPLLVGVAHGCQYIEKIDMRKWDIAMDVVVTDKQIKRCRSFFNRRAR